MALAGAPVTEANMPPGFTFPRSCSAVLPRTVLATPSTGASAWMGSPTRGGKTADSFSESEAAGRHVRSRHRPRRPAPMITPPLELYPTSRTRTARQNITMARLWAQETCRTHRTKVALSAPPARAVEAVGQDGTARLCFSLSATAQLRRPRPSYYYVSCCFATLRDDATTFPIGCLGGAIAAQAQMPNRAAIDACRGPRQNFAP